MEEKNFPICPYCEDKIEGIEWFNEVLANLIVFVCPHCRKILSVQKTFESMGVQAEPIIPKQSEIM